MGRTGLTLTRDEYVGDRWDAGETSTETDEEVRERLLRSPNLSRASTVRELVAAFGEAERVVRGAFQAIVDAEEMLNRAFTMNGSDRMRVDASSYGYHDNFADSILVMPGCTCAETMHRLQRTARIPARSLSHALR